MLHRRFRYLLVVGVALLAVSLGLVAALGGTSSWQAQQGDQISTLHASDQATVIAPERRVTRTNLASYIDTPIVLTVGEIVGLAALLAVAAGLLVAPPARGPDRRRRHLARVLRPPPAPARALIPVR